MGWLGRRNCMRVVELAKCGAHAASGVFILGYLTEEDKARTLQGLDDLNGVDDMIEQCAQVHDGDVRGVLLLQRKAFERRARGARRVAALLIPQGHHLDHGVKVVAFTAA
jgi:hypothetical protein